MIEANPFKFYLAKYSLLFFALLQWMVGGILFYLDEMTLGNVLIDGLFLVMGVLLVVLFSIVSDKIKRVVVGKNKFVVMDGNANLRFEWPEVKSLRILPFINLCRIKIKGKKGTFYFFSAGRIRSFLERLANSKNESSEFDVNNSSLT
jgi:hypothetical protein